MPAPPSSGGQSPSGGGFGSGGGSGSGRAGGASSARPILLGVAAVVALIAAVSAVLMLGGGDDDPSNTANTGTTAPAAATGDETTAPPETDDPGTTASTAPPSDDPFVQIDSVVIENGQYLVNFTITGFQPTFDQGGYHSHFYLNDVDAVNAGSNGPAPGDWDLTDATAEYLTKYSPAILSSRGATQMCSVVADSAHGIAFPGSGNCVDLPQAG